MAGGSSTYLRVAKKYSFVVLFPTFTAATIFADWSHTRAWKEQVKARARSQELLKDQ